MREAILKIEEFDFIDFLTVKIEKRVGSMSTL